MENDQLQETTVEKPKKLKLRYIFSIIGAIIVVILALIPDAWVLALLIDPLILAPLFFLDLIGHTLYSSTDNPTIATGVIHMIDFYLIGLFFEIRIKLIYKILLYIIAYIAIIIYMIRAMAQGMGA